MELISAQYRALNAKLHADSAEYGSRGASDAPQIVSFCRTNGFKIILDYGCGKGALRPAIKKIAPTLKVLEYDPAIPGKDRLPTRQPDFIVALDVMEHIEPDYLDNVISTWTALKPKCVMPVIALKPAKKWLADGRNAHLIVKPAPWWIERLNAYFTMLHHIETANHLTYIGAPR